MGTLRIWHYYIEEDVERYTYYVSGCMCLSFFTSFFPFLITSKLRVNFHTHLFLLRYTFSFLLFSFFIFFFFFDEFFFSLSKVFLRYARRNREREVRSYWWNSWTVNTLSAWNRNWKRGGAIYKKERKRKLDNSARCYAFGWLGMYHEKGIWYYDVGHVPCNAPLSHRVDSTFVINLFILHFRW